MDTPEDQLNSYRHAEESETKYDKVRDDPQFGRLMDLLCILVEKYGSKKFIMTMVTDYRYPRNGISQTREQEIKQAAEIEERNKYERQSWEEKR